MWSFRKPTSIPSAEDALPGRDTAIPVPDRHVVLGTALLGPYPDDAQILDVAMGCFWGAERTFWKQPGVITTLVGYQGGHTPNPTYEETCSGRTGHTEAVRVVFDPTKTSYEELVRVFWESHDPTQGMGQGNDVGTQYRSALYTHDAAQAAAAAATRQSFQRALTAAGRGEITTEIAPAGPFYPAEAHHQQYLHKVPNGYCGIGGTGVQLTGLSCPVGVPGVAVPTITS